MADALSVVWDGYQGYPMALALIEANLKTGAKKAKWKQIAEKLEQSHGAVNIKLLQLE